MQTKRLFTRALITLPVAVYAVISLYPFVWIVLQSFKTEQEFLTSIWSLPNKLHWENYKSAWVNSHFSIFYKNSLFVTCITVLICLVFCALAGYAFGRLRFLGKKPLLVMLVAVLLVPTPVLLLPVYLIVRDLGLLNTYLGLIGPYTAGTLPLGILLMRSYFQEVPQDLADSAKIDGCREFGTFYRVMLPLTMPGLATLAILNFISIWNEYMWALISLSDQKLYTLPIGMARMEGQKFVFGNTTVFAGIVLSSLLIFVVFLSMQKYFVKAISEGAVKG